MPYTVRDVLAYKGSRVHTVPPDATVRDAVLRMNEHHIGAVLVVDSRLLGIFTERDVLARVVAEGRSPETTRVGDVMSSRVTTVREDETLCDVLACMTRERHRHMPVLSGDRVVGLVSIGDLIAHHLRELGTEVNDLTEYIAGPAARHVHEEILFIAETGEL